MVILVIGIYKITNKLNNKCYIGQSVDIKRRLNEHKKHKDNSLIDNEISKMGVENFIFEILETCDIIELNRRESYYIKKYNSIENGYNISHGSTKDRIINYIKVINISEKIDSKDDLFNILDWNKYCTLSSQLSPSALKLYVYLSKYKTVNKNDYCNIFNLSDKTFRNAVRELYNNKTFSEFSKKEIENLL